MSAVESDQKDSAALVEAVRATRKPDYDVNPLFVERWSPRAFSPSPIDDHLLNQVLEAARWAPSSYNEQPWRFIIARTAEDRARFVDFLMPLNQVWAQNAPVLILIISKRFFTHNGQQNLVSQFDAGCAWGFLALNAWEHGLITHGMAGFDRDRARQVLDVPEEFDVLAVIAMGRHEAKPVLPEQFQKMEVPSGRRPVSNTIMEGKFRREEGL